MDHQVMMRQMVTEQIVARGIHSQLVIAAFLRVPRHEFVDSADQIWAYGDHPLDIGAGQTVSQPYIVALMTETIGISPTDRVLEIGTGSGYQTAILACLSAEVFTIERIAKLQEKAISTLTRLGFSNIRHRLGNGYGGWQEQAPFAAIIVTAAAPTIPSSLLEQLAVGGRMVIPVGGPWNQELLLLQKTTDGITCRSLCECRFVPLIDAE
ncbi:MAG: protein-L-isoaspartate(D-aspartate) O-methyltransferase [bacterium]